MRQEWVRTDPRLQQLLHEISRHYHEAVITDDIDIPELLDDILSRAKALQVGLNRTTLLDIIRTSMVLIQSIDQEAELKFRRERRMFYIVGDILRIAEAGDERDHKEWMIDEGDYNSFEEAIRGYVNETGLFAYRGSDHTLSLESEANLCEHLNQIVGTLDLNPDLEVWSGVKPGRWRKLGKIRDILNWG